MIHLYSDPRCPFSHLVRLVLYIKGMDFKIIDLSVSTAQDRIFLGAYDQFPILRDDIDRNRKQELILSDIRIMCEYIDDRFPHPQLMPIAPSERARLRMLFCHIEKNLFTHIRYIESNFATKDAKLKKTLEMARKKLSSCLDELAAIFVQSKKLNFIFNNTFTMIDAAVLPILWRLKYYDIEVKKSWAPMIKYAENQFHKEAFIAASTPIERGMR